MKRYTINELAEILACGDMHVKQYNVLFLELYNELRPRFTAYVNDYICKRDLSLVCVDQHMFESEFNLALMDALNGFNAIKGEFLPRLWYFTRRRFNHIVSYHSAKKRYGVVIGLDDVEMPVVDTYFRDNDVVLLNKIQKFIESDRYGMVIYILLHEPDRDIRRVKLVEYFGKYEARERQIVKRTRERLRKHLQEEKECH